MEDHLLCSAVTLAAPVSNPIRLTCLQLRGHHRSSYTPGSPRLNLIQTVNSFEDFLILLNKDRLRVMVGKIEEVDENPPVCGHFVKNTQITNFPLVLSVEEIGDLALIQDVLMVCRVYFLSLTFEECTVAHPKQAYFSQFGQSGRQFPHHVVNIPAGMWLSPLELFK